MKTTEPWQQVYLSWFLGLKSGLSSLGRVQEPWGAVCTPFDRTGRLVALCTKAKELSGREERQAGVWVDLIVILEPGGKRAEGGLGVGEDGKTSIVALERFDEGLGNAVRLGRARRGEAVLEPECGGGVEGVAGDIGAAVVGKPFDGMWCAGRGEQRLDAGVVVP